MKILFIYPNHKGKNMLPPGVALLSACLKREGHEVKLFDTTYYDSVEIDGQIDKSDSDKSKGDRLMARPYAMPKNVVKVKYTNVFDDFRKEVESYNPDLLALSSTEDMFHLGINLLKRVEDLIKGFNEHIEKMDKHINDKTCVDSNTETQLEYIGKIISAVISLLMQSVTSGPNTKSNPKGLGQS